MMKRLLFYVALLLQIAILIIIVIQHQLIDNYGQSIQLKTVKQDFYGSYDPTYDQNVYSEYDINFIQYDQLDTNETLDYNEKVYVLLELTDENVYEVVKVRKDNFFKPTENQIVLIGKYQYEDTWTKRHIVHYGFEWLDRQEIGDEYRPNRLAILTVKVAPWGQMKVIEMNQIDQ